MGKKYKIILILCVLMIVLMAACKPETPTAVKEIPAETSEPKSPMSDVAAETQTEPDGEKEPFLTTQFMCTPGQTLINPKMSEYIDLEKVETKLDGEVLTTIFTLKSIPPTIVVNREGIQDGEAEFIYEITVDLTPQDLYDSNMYDILLYRLKNGAEINLPFEDALNTGPMIFKFEESGEYSELPGATYSIDRAANAIIITAELPGIAPTSSVTFRTLNRSGNHTDQDVVCSSSYANGNPCIPNQTYQTEEKAPFVDIQKITSTLNGEELTVVFFVKDIPDEITINRDRVRYDESEGGVKAPDYFWEINIDTDNDPSTGVEGFDYEIAIFRPRDSKEPTTGSFEELFTDYAKFAAKQFYEVSYASQSPARLAVDEEANTIALTATIPGITPDSYLMYYAYDEGFDVRIQDTFCKR